MYLLDLPVPTCVCIMILPTPSFCQRLVYTPKLQLWWAETLMCLSLTISRVLTVLLLSYVSALTLFF